MSSLRAALAVGALLAGVRRARADDPPPLILSPPAPPAAVAPLGPSDGASPARRLADALRRFEFGDYEGVVSELAVLVEAGARTLPPADRLEALRAYGIACALIGRPTAAEGAFLLLLKADPGARLEPQLVRPEAVALFDAVRGRNRDALLGAYRKGRGRRYAVLNLLPPAGQLQNHDYVKGYALLGVELALLASNVTSGALLYSWQGEHKDFPGHEDAPRALRPLNWVSFGALVSVLAYGIIDGFVVGHRRRLEERRVEDSLRAGAIPF